MVNSIAATGGGEPTHSYSVESGGEVKMTKQEIIEMIERAGFDRGKGNGLQSCGEDHRIKSTLLGGSRSFSIKL